MANYLPLVIEECIGKVTENKNSKAVHREAMGAVSSSVQPLGHLLPNFPPHPIHSAIWRGEVRELEPFNEDLHVLGAKLKKLPN